MAKSTRAQEVSTGTSDSYTLAELSDPSPPIRIQRAMLGVVPQEVLPSVGMDSFQSSGNEATKNDNENPSHQPPAPTTENPFGLTDTADSDADSTDGDGQEEAGHLQSDDDEEDYEDANQPVARKPTAAKKAATKKARARTVGDDDFSLLD